MPSLPAPDGDPFTAILRGIADARVTDAAAARARAHWMARQAEEDATLADALADLAERHATVQLHLRAGSVVHGVIDAVGEDALALSTPAGVVFVRGDRVISVHGQDLAVPTVAGRPTRPSARGRSFAELVRHAAADRPWCHVVTDDGRELFGRLRAAGADVLSVQTDAATSRTVIVALDAVAAIGLLSRV